MTKFFDDLGYLELPNFLDEKDAKTLSNFYKTFINANNIEMEHTGDIYTNAYQVEYYYSFYEILCLNVPRLTNILNEYILPTYAVGRIYCKGASLRPHRDRSACEISLTINLSQDKIWSMNLIDLSKQEKSIIQKPGDALLYKGCEVEHWRDPYGGEEYVQVFLHYVYSRGKNKSEYFDRKRFAGDLTNLVGLP